MGTATLIGSAFPVWTVMAVAAAASLTAWTGTIGSTTAPSPCSAVRIANGDSLTPIAALPAASVVTVTTVPSFCVLVMLLEPSAFRLIVVEKIGLPEPPSPSVPFPPDPSELLGRTLVR